MAYFTIAGEGALDLALARKVIEYHGHQVAAQFDKRGKNNLDKNIPGYLNASRVGKWLILRDLDQDNCAVHLIRQIAPNISAYPNMFLRVCVRAIESWILADHAGFSQFFSVRSASVPVDPEALPNPKTALLQVVAGSRHRSLRERVLPRVGSGRVIGPEYNAVLTDFIAKGWNVNRASERSDSLRRMVTRVGEA